MHGGGGGSGVGGGGGGRPTPSIPGGYTPISLHYMYVPL